MSRRDRRELILSGIKAIGDQLQRDEVVKTAARNQTSFSGGTLPAFSVLDGDEPREEFDQSASGYPFPRTQIVPMTPQILIDVGDSRHNVGSVLNAIRLAVIRAILFDASLAELVGSNGTIEYHGLSTDLAFTREMQGRQALQFLFKYPLFPREL